MRPRIIFRAEYLLPIACLASAVVLGASEFMNTFALRPPGGETVEHGLLAAGDRHKYALLVLAIFAVVALIVAVLTGSKPAAVAVAVAGAVALLLFLVSDLPHVNEEGTPASLFGSTPGALYGDLKAYPASGFWFEVVGALALAICGGALATLDEGQLNLLDRFRKQPDRQESEATRDESPARRPASRRRGEHELARRRD